MKWLFEFDDKPTNTHYPITGFQVFDNGAKKGPFHFSMKSLIDALQSQPEGNEDPEELKLMENSTPTLPNGTIRYSASDTKKMQRITIEIPQKMWDIRYGTEDQSFFNIGFPRMVIQFLITTQSDTEFRVTETRIYALLNDKKPITDNTPLYQFPYPNVSKGNAIVCWGGNERLVIKDIVELERLFQWFVAAPFCEDHGVRTTLGIPNFRKLIDEIQDKPFNDDWLMPSHDVFSQLFE